MFLRTFLKITFLTLTILVFFTCREKEKPSPPKRVFEGYHVYLDSILVSKKSLFRNLSLNMPPDSVLKKEKSAPVEKSPVRLYYEYPLDSLSDYSIEYKFVNDSLTEINLNIYSSDQELISYLYCDLKDYFAYVIPQNMEEKGYVIYNCVEGERRPFVIYLSDVSTTGKGIISLHIYKD